MPFFLSSKPAAKPTRAKLVVADKTKAKPGRAPQARDLTWLWLILGMLLCAGLGAGWHFARQGLRMELAARAPVPTGPQAIRMDIFRFAPWVSDAEIRSLTDAMGACLSNDPLDGQGLAEAARTLERHPAVKKVLRMNRDERGLVRIGPADVLLHQPAGLVVAGNGSLSAVDSEGHLLAENLPADLAKRLPVARIEGVTTASPSGGKEAIWKDPGLQAALSLILRLSDAERRALRTAAIGTEPAGKHHRTTLTLFLQIAPEQTLEILWGLPIDEESGVDAAPEVKLRALRALCAKPEVRAGKAGTRFAIRSGSAVALSSAQAVPAPGGEPASRGRRP